MKRLRRDVRTHAALADFTLAVENYARITRDWPADKRKYFSTFMEEWRDHIDPDVVASAEAASAARGKPNGSNSARGPITPMAPVTTGGRQDL